MAYLQARTSRTTLISLISVEHSGITPICRFRTQKDFTGHLYGPPVPKESAYLSLKDTNLGQIIHDPDEEVRPVDEDRVFMMNDLYHQPSEEVSLSGTQRSVFSSDVPTKIKGTSFSANT